MSNYAFSRAIISISSKIVIPQTIIDKIKTDYNYDYKMEEQDEIGEYYVFSSNDLIKSEEKFEEKVVDTMTKILKLVGVDDDELFAYMVEDYNYDSEGTYIYNGNLLG